jgi:hypothetical protein
VFPGKASFDGINDYIDINDATLGNNYEALTVEAWINPENLPASPGRRYIVNACDEDSFSNNSLFSLHLATVASDSRYLPASFRGTNIIFGVRAKDQPDINAAIALSDASYWRYITEEWRYVTTIRSWQTENGYMLSGFMTVAVPNSILMANWKRRVLTSRMESIVLCLVL